MKNITQILIAFVLLIAATMTAHAGRGPSIDFGGSFLERILEFLQRLADILPSFLQPLIEALIGVFTHLLGG